MNAAKGLSACQLSRDLNVQYKTAFTLAHKIRESLQIQKQLFPLSGEIHIDGLMFILPHVLKTRKVNVSIDV